MHSRNVPALRLEGFDGEWETTTLGELGSFKSGVGFPEREQGGGAGLPFYKVSDLSAPGNELQLRSANHYVTEEQIVRNHWIPVTAVPAILFAKVGAAVFLGRKRLATDIFLLDNNLMAFSLDTKSWDVQFADTYLKTVDLTRFTQSGALPSLNARHLAEAAATIPPTLEEQQAIGAIFTNLDAAINQHTKKHQALQQAKTALMQRMFPQAGQMVPELRLEGFDGEWKTTSIGAVSALHNGRDYKHLGEGCIPVYGTGGYMVSVDQALSHDEDAVGIGRKGTINKPYILKAPFWTVDTLFYVVPNQETDLAFFYASVLQVDWMTKNTATGLPSLTSQTINSADISIPPTLEEQQAIGAVFTRLDTLISTEAKCIESLKQAKAALLQQMFI